MITGIINTSVYVLNLQTAIDFYVHKLGFKVHTDILVDGAQQCVSLYVPGKPATQLILIPVVEGPIFTRQDAQQMRHLISREVFSYGVFRCLNLRQTVRALKSKGVRFLMEPGCGFLGQYEASFIDDSGNWFRLTEQTDAV